MDQDLGPLAPMFSAEIIELILQCLSSVQIVCVRRVCRQWAAVGQDIVQRRGRGTGPFIVRRSRDVPMSCKWPLFQTQDGDLLSHPAVALADVRFNDHLIFSAYSVSAKRTRGLGEIPRLPARLFNKRYLPRVRELRLGMDDVDTLGVLGHGASPLAQQWPGVEKLNIHGSVLRAGKRTLAEMFPSCNYLNLEFHQMTTFAEDIAHWKQITQLELNFVKASWSDLPASNLINLKLVTSSFDGQTIEHQQHALSSEEFWPSQQVVRDSNEVFSNEIYQVLELPLVETLTMSNVMMKFVAFKTPRLKCFNLHFGNYVALQKDALTNLEELNLFHVNILELDLDCLTAFPLKRLKLVHVKPKNMCFLEHLTNLETLELNYIEAPPFVLPCQSLQKLKNLRIHTACSQNIFKDATNLAQLGALETLTLVGANDVTELSWMRALKKLTCLILRELWNLVSLDGIESPPALSSLRLHHLKLTDCSPIQNMPALTTLHMEIMICYNGLNLTSTPLRHLHVEHCDIRGLTLPTELRSLTLKHSTSAHQFSYLPILKNLKKFEYVSEFVGEYDLASFSESNLETLALTGKTHNYSNVNFEKVKASHISIDLGDATPSILRGNTAISLQFVASNWVPNDLSWVNAEVIVRLHVTICPTSLVPDFSALAHCKKLEYLTVTCPRLESIVGLTGHPTLREVHLFCNSARFIDIAPLLTCPKLVVAEITNFAVSETQQQQLLAYLTSQNL